MAKEPEVIGDKNLMRLWSRSMRSQGKTIALVPTMGYLHRGHLSLIQEAQTHAHLTVVSIYVNPGQFSPYEDLATYPSDFQGDIQKLREAGVDVVFHPQNLYQYETDTETTSGSIVDLGFDDGKDQDLGLSSGKGEENPSGLCGNLDTNGLSEREGKDAAGSSENLGFHDGKERKAVSCIEAGGGRLGHETWIRVEKLERGLCGKSRPVFFRGVATVVAKLFNIVEPDFAIFGKKDYQQWRIIHRMVRDLDFGIDVIGSEIVRDADGLALSSRNVHLLPEERKKALSINQSLSKAKLAALNGQVSCSELKDSVIQEIVDAGGTIDYAEIVDQESLHAVEEIRKPVVFCVATWFGKVRLIDNMEINIQKGT